MKKMQLLLSKLSSSQAPYPLWSVIYVRIDDLCFPDNEWWDASSAMLHIWSENIGNVLRGHVNNCVLPFLDGNYHIAITCTGKNIVCVKCIHYERIVACFQDVDLLYFTRQLISGATRIIDYDRKSRREQASVILSHSLEQLRKAYESAKIQIR